MIPLLRMCAFIVAMAFLAGCNISAVDPAPGGGVIGAAPVEGDRARVVYVIDGDTIEVEQGGTRFRVRYVGVNTPESDEPCYAEATAANRTLVENRTVVLLRDTSDVDRFDRLLRYIYLEDGTFVNAALVREGWAEAVEYRPDVRFTNEFRALEVAAANADRGCHNTGIFDDGSQTR